MKNRPVFLYIFLFISILCPYANPEVSGENTSFLIGNGNILVGVEKEGNISVVRWRGVGGSNHIGDSSKNRLNIEGGVLEPTAFMIQIQDSLYSLTDSMSSYIQGRYKKPEIPLLEFEGTTKNNKITWKQEVFVHPSKDIICIHFNFDLNRQNNVTENFISYQNISIQPPLIIENPFLSGFSHFYKDFCVFWDAILQTLIYFRPYNSGQSDLYRIQEVRNSAHIPKKFWNKFEEGVYVGILSINPVIGADILNYPLSENSSSQIISQNIPTELFTSGNFCSSLVIRPATVNNTREVTLYYIWSRNYSEAEETVQWIKNRNYHQIKEEFFFYWQEKWEIARKSINDKFANNWLHIFLCSDPRTGAILTRPLDPVYGNRISLQDSLFQVQSMNDMGMLNFSKNLILFWNNVGKERKSLAKQTFPLWVYTDGKPACPDYWVDISQTANFLSMVSALSDYMDFNEKKEFLNEIWDILMWSINNLCLWKVPGDLLPAPSFTEVFNRDMQSANLLIQTLIGMQQGIQLAKAIFKPVPKIWETRVNELQTWIRLAILKKEVLESFPDKNSTLWEKFFPRNNIVWQLPVKYNGDIIPLKDMSFK